MLNNKLGMKLKQGLSLNITEDNYTLSKINHTRDISQRRIFPVIIFSQGGICGGKYERQGINHADPAKRGQNPIAE
jgi:hypothetical protein